MAVTVFHLPISLMVTALFNLLGGVLLLLSLPALYARQAKQIGWIGLVGLVIIWLDMLIFPVLAGGIAGLVPAFKLPDVLFFLSFSAFGVVLLSQRGMCEGRPTFTTEVRDAVSSDR